MSKEQKLKELENEFKEKQIKMSEEIKLEIREELKIHEGKKISISEISQLTEKITKTKLKLFETEIADHLEKMKLAYDLGKPVKILLYTLWHMIYSKVSIDFICTDSFWPLTCKKIQIGAHASVHIKSTILLYDILCMI